MTAIDYFILDMLGKHFNYEEIREACLREHDTIVKYRQINILHRRHFPT